MEQRQKDVLRALVKPEHYRENEPLSKHTTFRVGGPAEVLLTPDAAELRAVLLFCREENVPLTVLGNGSNVLVSDRGIEGVVAVLGAAVGEIVVEEAPVSGEDRAVDMMTERPPEERASSEEAEKDVSKDNAIIYEIRAGAGAMLGAIAQAAAEASLAGMEFAAGIPGTLGGAVLMNAGAYGGEMKDILTEVTVLTRDGEEKTYQASELDLSYRHSRFSETDEIILSATMRLQKGDEAEIREKMRELNARRREKQPLEYPSAGSTFKRPEGFFAGKLIEDTGLRGFSVGGAAVSEKHCGFVINTGNATAADIDALIKEVRRRVLEHTGVTLEPEVRYIGVF